MFKRLLLGLGLVGLLALSAQEPAAHSQGTDDADCEALVTQALQVLGTACAEVGRNEACYGHSRVAATFREEVDGVSFATSGDTTALTNLEALVTEPLDMDAGTWGVALMRLQADLPESDPDSSMTLILFGDTEVTNVVDPSMPTLPTCSIQNTSLNNMNMRSGPGLNRPITSVFPRDEEGQAVGRSDDNDWVRLLYNGTLGWVFARNMQLDCEIDTLQVTGEDDPLTGYYDKPMQAFTLQSGGDSACAAAPNGLLVESPEGQRAHVMVNGIEMEFASAGFLSVDRDGGLRVSGLAGEIRIRSADETVLLLPGMQSLVPLLDAATNLRGRPENPQPFDINPLDAMPLEALREYLGDIIRLDIDNLLDVLPMLPDPITDGAVLPTLSVPVPQPTADAGVVPSPRPSEAAPVPRRCFIGDTVMVNYTATNFGSTSGTFRLYLTDGTRYVSDDLPVTVGAGEMVGGTEAIPIIESVPATVEVVTVVAVLDDTSPSAPNIVVTATGELHCYED